MALRLTEAQVGLLKVDTINSRTASTALYMTGGSTVYISSASNTSLIMRMGTTEVARVSAKGNFIIGAEDVTTTDYKLKVTGATGFANGHLYLTGANATSASSNTTQLVFGEPGNNHVAISSNNNAIVINPTSSTTTNQIVLDLDEHSLFPTGLKTISTTDSTSTTTGSIITSGGIGVAKNIYSGQKIDAVQGLGIKATTGTGVGISLYSGSTGTSAPTYGLMFAKTASFSAHGGVSGDWATYFTMSDTTTRGWIFRRGSTNIASISGTGYLTLNAGMNLGGNITYNNGSYTDYEMIKFITGNANGAGIVIGGGGLVVVGSGESASALVTSASLAGGTETTYITSDGNIEFYTNCQTIDSRVGVILNTSRYFYPNVTNTGSLGTSSYNWASVHARALTSAAALALTSTNATTITSGGATTISSASTTTVSSASTIYLTTTSAASIIFTVNGTECGRWNPSGKLMIGSTSTQSDYELYVNGQSYFNGYTMTNNIHYADKAGTAHGFYIRTNGTWTSRWYQGVRGTVGDGTNAVAGYVYLMLGNAIATSTSTTAGAENSYGILRIYGSNTGYTNIRTGTNNTSGYTMYLPGDNGQFVYHTNDTQIGSSTVPVYIASTGKATACGSLWTNSSTSSTSEFQVGVRSAAGTLYMYSQGDATKNRGLYGANNAGTAVSILTINKDNVVTLNGRATQDGNGNTITSYYCTLSTEQTITARKTFSGGITITKATDAAVGADNGPALIVGGASTAAHIEIDANEIMAKANGTSGAELFLNVGGSRVNVPYLKIESTAAVEHIAFSRGGFNYIKAPASGTIAFVVNGQTVGSNTAELIISDGSLYPGTNNATSLGSSSYRWSTVYGVAGNFSGNVTLTRSTTIANNTPAKLTFTVTQTDNSLTSSGYIACYDDLDAYSYGVNMVVNATSGLYLTAGEGAASYLANNASVAEDVHICADAAIYFHTNCNTVANSTKSCYITTAGYIYGARVYGAVWNDYAEYRSAEITEPGRVVQESSDGIMKLATARLQSGCEIISDTFGFAIGETDKCKTPIAATGRVLAYPFEDKDSYELGQAVCSGPNGTVSKMTREEIMMYPERIIGTVSEIPKYETWGTGNINVNGRIWIRIK